MPFYEYQCEKCGHDVEVMQKVSDAPLKKCPRCGKSSLKRLMSAPVFRLKGSGWYETDFKSDQDNKRNLADKPEPESKEDKSDAKKDSTAEAKKEDKKPDAPVVEAKKPAAESGSSSSSRAPAARAARKPQAKPQAKSKTKPKARAKRR